MNAFWCAKAIKNFIDRQICPEVSWSGRRGGANAWPKVGVAALRSLASAAKCGIIAT